MIPIVASPFSSYVLMYAKCGTNIGCGANRCTRPTS